MTLIGTLEIRKIFEGLKLYWEVASYIVLPSDIIPCSPTFNFLGNNFYLQIGPNEDNDHISVRLKVDDEVVLVCHMMCTIGIIKTDGSLVGINSNSYTFSNFSRELAFLEFYKIMSLFDKRSQILPSDNLTLMCKLEPLGDSMKLRGFDRLSENIKRLFFTKEFCDVTLLMNDKEFKTHKSILAARSPVFAAMLNHETSEKQIDIINITDCDPESFEYFLLYLYSGEFKVISFQNALHLYKTADKYNVEELKKFCIAYLSNNLKVENFHDAVILAEEFDEKDLLANVQNFFNRNLKEIFSSDEWYAFFNENSSLANKLLLEMAMKVNVTEE